MNIKNLAAAALVAAGTLAAVPAYAQMKWQGFYVGGGIGQSKIDDFDTAGINSVVLSRPGVTSAITSVDDKDTGWKVFAGYQVNQNFAVEAGYVNLGKFSTFTTVTPFGTVAGEVKMENNWFGDVLGIVPLGNNFSIFGRIGLVWSETKVSASGTIPPAPGTSFGIGRKDDDFSWKFGLGLGYDFTPQWGVRGEWERYRVSDGSGGKSDADLFSVSLRFRF